MKKVTAERSATNPARYEKFSDRIKELIVKFNKGLVDAEEVLTVTEDVAKQLQVEDSAHQGTGLSERAYSIHAILKNFGLDAGGETGDDDQPSTTGEATPGYSADSETKGAPSLSALQEVAQAIDALYASDESAPPHWQDKGQLKKSLRGEVRRLVRPLGLDGWQKQIPMEVQEYAIVHYGKP